MQHLFALGRPKHAILQSRTKSQCVLTFLHVKAHSCNAASDV